MRTGALAGALSLVAGAAYAAGPIEAGTIQPTNWNAIIIFLAFVVVTLGITYWAAQRTRTTKDFYAAGGGITGFQNGLAIAGDYMSAASFLGIVALVYSSGYYGLIYSIGFLVGWPFIMFLMAEPLRNLGRFTFADVASYRLQATPIRAMAATGTLVTVAFYLIAQMVGAGQLIELLFGLPYLWAVVVVGVLMIIYVTFGGMIATTWVQIIKAGLLLGRLDADGAPGAGAVRLRLQRAHRQGDRGPSEPREDPDCLARQVANPINAFSLGMALMFGTAGLPHILMRFFTVGNAKEARKSVFWATTFIGYFYILTFILGFGAIVLVGTNPAYHVGDDIKKRAARRRQHAGDPSRAGGRRRLDEGLHRGGRVRDDPGGRFGPDAFGRERRQPRPLRERLPTRQGRGRRRSSRVADHHGHPRHCRDPSRRRVREDQRRLHGRPRLRGRGERELPGAVALHAVEGADDPGRGDRRLRRSHQRAGADDRQPGDLGGGVRLSEGSALVPLRVAGAVHHAALLLLLLDLLGHRQLEDGQAEQAAFEAQYVRSQTGIGADTAVAH